MYIMKGIVQALTKLVVALVKYSRFLLFNGIVYFRPALLSAAWLFKGADIASTHSHAAPQLNQNRTMRNAYGTSASCCSMGLFD